MGIPTVPGLFGCMGMYNLSLWGDMGRPFLGAVPLAWGVEDGVATRRAIWALYRRGSCRCWIVFLLSLSGLGDYSLPPKNSPPGPPRNRQRGRVSTLSLSGLSLSTTKEGPLRRPLFGNSPWLLCRLKAYPRGLLRHAAGVRTFRPRRRRFSPPKSEGQGQGPWTVGRLGYKERNQARG